MHEILDIIRHEYGGAEEYLKEHGGLTGDEIDVFRRIFVVTQDAA